MARGDEVRHRRAEMRNPYKGATAGLSLRLGNTTRDGEVGGAIYADMKSLAEAIDVDLRDHNAVALSAELPVWFELVVGYVAARALIRDAALLTKLATQFVANRARCTNAMFSYDDGRTIHRVETADEEAINGLPQLVQATQIWAGLMPELARSHSVGWRWQYEAWLPIWCSADHRGGRQEVVPTEMYQDTARFIRGTPGVDVDMMGYADDQLLALIETARRHVRTLLADPRARIFDPDRVFWTLVSFARARVAAVHRMPLLGEVRPRVLPKFSGTSDFDGRGYVARAPLQQLLDDADALLGLWPAATRAPVEDDVAANESTQGDPRKVFVVHGRNRAARDAIFALLRAVDLRPVEWNEARAETKSASPYLYDVLMAGMSMARAVVVVVTPDEEARLAKELRTEAGDDDVAYQSRPNVLFEAGMAFMKARDRTVIVEFHRALTASDLDGISVVRVDASAGSVVRKDIVDRLRSAGCTVNDRGADWLQAGDFAAAAGGSGPRG